MAPKFKYGDKVVVEAGSKSAGEVFGFSNVHTRFLSFMKAANRTRATFSPPLWDASMAGGSMLTSVKVGRLVFG